MREEKSCPYQGANSDPSAVQPVASRYTDWAVPLYIYIYTLYIYYQSLTSIPLNAYVTPVRRLKKLWSSALTPTIHHYGVALKHRNKTEWTQFDSWQRQKLLFLPPIPHRSGAYRASLMRAEIRRSERHADCSPPRWKCADVYTDSLTQLLVPCLSARMRVTTGWTTGWNIQGEHRAQADSEAHLVFFLVSTLDTFTWGTLVEVSLRDVMNSCRLTPPFLYTFMDTVAPLLHFEKWQQRPITDRSFFVCPTTGGKIYDPSYNRNWNILAAVTNYWRMIAVFDRQLTGPTWVKWCVVR
jgi:hypothetical protein